MKVQYHIVTGAQMGAKVNRRGWNSLLHIAEDYKAKIHVTSLRGVTNHGRPIEILKEEVAYLEAMIMEENDKLDEAKAFLKKNKEDADAIMEVKVLEKEIAKLQEKKNKSKDLIEDLYPPELRPYIVKTNIQLDFNSNICLDTSQIAPSSVKPLTGMKRLVEKTTIFGSPKFQLDVIPGSPGKLPRIMLSSGAITEPNYTQSRVGSIANKDHIYGAILIKVIDDNIFHFRHLSINKKGEITDLGTKYSSQQKIEAENVEAIVTGDTHVGFHDPAVDRATEEMITQLKPKYWVVHDLFDAFSISHHHIHDLVLLAQKAKEFEDFNGVKMFDDLEKELEMNCEFILDKQKKFPDLKILIVASNHNEALDRYIREGRFMKDPKNSILGAKLYIEMAERGANPLEYWFKHLSKYKKQLQNIVFLKRGQDFKVAGVQVSNHGDLGANGGFGSLSSEESGANLSVVGHSHSSCIFAGVWRVGTSTYLKLAYNKGYSSWTHANVLINKDSTRQMIHIINGAWNN